jgi:hypothetical protein
MFINPIKRNMDSGEISAIIAFLGSIAVYFNAGDLVPYIGPTVQGVIAVITFGAAAWSWYQHRAKNNAIPSL